MAKSLDDIILEEELRNCNTATGINDALEHGFAGIIEKGYPALMEIVRQRRELARRDIKLDGFVIGWDLRLDEFGNIHRIIYRKDCPMVRAGKDLEFVVRGRTFLMPIGKLLTSPVKTEGFYWKVIDRESIDHLGCFRPPRAGTVCPHCKKRFEIDDLASIIINRSLWDIPPIWISERKLYAEAVDELNATPEAEYDYGRHDTASFWIERYDGLTVFKTVYLHAGCYLPYLFESRQRQFEELLAAAGFQTLTVKRHDNPAGRIFDAGPWFRIKTQFGFITVGVAGNPDIYIGVDELGPSVREMIKAEKPEKISTNGIYVYGADHAALVLQKIFALLDQPTS